LKPENQFDTAYLIYAVLVLVALLLMMLMVMRSGMY